MYKTLLHKIATGETITREDIENELHEICDNEHSSCNDRCPVYASNGSCIPNTLNSRRGCDCFKDGVKMFTFIRQKYLRNS